MGSLGWASVPLYDLFCRVTGYGGTTAISDGSNIEVLDRTIDVRFDASKASDMPWEFKPVQREMEPDG
jgi:cytochrome c oxidase assembly protein subunit 11